MFITNGIGINYDYKLKNGIILRLVINLIPNYLFRYPRKSVCNTIG